MTISNYLLIHKEHPLVLNGANGGAEMATRRLAQFLVRAGKKVVVAGYLPQGETNIDGVEYWSYGQDYDLQSIWKRADIALHSYHLIAVGRAQPLLESRSNKSIVTRSLALHDRHGNDAGIGLSIVSRVVDHIFAVSVAHRDELIQAGADAKVIQIIGNGVDVEVFSIAPEQNRDPYKLVFAGALVQDKGLHLLLQAFATLKSRYPALSLDVFGSAGLWGRESIYDQPQIEAQLPGVKFKGAVTQEELAKGFQRAAICVVPSIWFETFGLVSIEAQSTGCPVVVFRNGGLGEGVVDGITGRIIQKVSLDDLTATLAELLADREKTLRLGEAAALLVREQFTWEAVAKKVIDRCEIVKNPSIQGSVSTAIGVISTWNQQCGLATYAKYLFSEFEPHSYFVFAEDSISGQVAADESFVQRCWQRRGDDLQILQRAIIQKGIKLLHLNFHDHSFIDHQYLLPFLARMREQKIKIVSHLHTTYALDPRFVAFLVLVDKVIVHSPESRLQVIAAGAAPETVHVLSHGVLPIERPDGNKREVIRRQFMPNTNAALLTSFGFIQPNKGIEAVIEAVGHLTSRSIASYGYIAGRVNESHPQAQSYFEELKSHAQRLGVADRIGFSNRFLSEAEVADCLSVSDVVFMNYNSHYYEASGACARAVGAGALVIASLSPNFSHFGDAVWHSTAGFPAGVSAELLISNTQLAAQLRSNIERYIKQFSWSSTALHLKNLYQEWGYQVIAQEPKLNRTDTQILETSASFAETISGQIENAELSLRNGQYQDARTLLKTIIGRSPQEERAIRALATLELSENNLNAARYHFMDALKLQPNNAKTLGGLGMVALGEGNLPQAHGYLLQSLAHDPDFMLGLKNLIFTGFALEKYHDIERSIRSYLAHHPEDNEIQYCLAGCLYKQQDVQAARIVLEAVLARDSMHENSRELLDKILVENKAQDPSPASAEVDLRIAQLEEAKKQRLLDAVYRGLDTLEKELLTPQQMESVYILRGETFAMDSEFDKAEVVFSQVLEANPQSGRAMSGRGAIALGREQLTEAEQWFNKALLQTDRKDIALTGLGLCSQWQSKPDAAWEYYQKALAINPENEQALYGAVQIGMLRREFALVERCLRGFLDLRPANLDHLYSLAGCLYAQQKFLDALDELEKLLLFEPSHMNSLELKTIILSRKDVVVHNSANDRTLHS